MRASLACHWVKTYFRTLAACLETFGLRRPGWFFYCLLKIPARLLYLNVSMFLDYIFFPGHRHAEVRQPLFIMGHPRSGTTFLHELLTQTGDFAVFKAWEVFHPSLTARAVLERASGFRKLFSARLTPGLANRFGGMEQATGHDAKRGRTPASALDAVVHEEELLFANIFDTQFSAFDLPLGFTKRGYPELVFCDLQPHRERSVRFFKACLKRQVHSTGKGQIIAKANFSLMRVKTLLNAFPDAKIIYLARSPLETQASHLSLHRRILDTNFGLARLPEAGVKRYYEHRYRYNIAFYRYFEELMEGKTIPSDRLLEITYDSLRDDLGGVLDRIAEFSGLSFSPELGQRVAEQVERQSSYRRPHENLPLSAFDLSERQVREDFSFVFDRYGFGRDGDRAHPDTRGLADTTAPETKA